MTLTECAFGSREKAACFAVVGQELPLRSTPPGSATLFRAIEADADHAALVVAVIQSRNGGAGFMPLHLDGGKSTAIAGEDITRHLE